MRRRLLASAVVLAALSGCAAADPLVVEDIAPPAAGPAESTPAESAPPQAGVAVSGDGWSARFPGEPEQFLDEVPVPELGITLTTDTTAYESPTEAYAVITAELPMDPAAPASAEELRQQLFASGAAVGVIVDGSPLLDDDGLFRGRDAIVVTSDAGDLNALMFVDASSLFQVIQVTTVADGGAGLSEFVEGLTLDN